MAESDDKRKADKPKITFNPATHDYAKELRAAALPRSDPLKSHPLDPAPEPPAPSPTSKAGRAAPAAPPPDDAFPDDPLADPLAEVRPAPAAVFRPVSTFAPAAVVAPAPTAADEEAPSAASKMFDSFASYPSMQATVLQNYTTDKSIAVFSKIVEDDVDTDRRVLTATEKARIKLEELDAAAAARDGLPAGGSGTTAMSQAQVVAHLEGLADQLSTAWDSGEKVRSLRIVIQCGKLLMTVQVPQMYPSLCILVAKVLDRFGALVYDRIKTRSVAPGARGVERVRACDVSDDGREMCRNWLYKIASIRELGPRLYVELSLAKCTTLLDDSDAGIAAMFQRFVSQVRGIGDPLVAAYMRVFAARKCYEVAPAIAKRVGVCRLLLADWAETHARQWGARKRHAVGLDGPAYAYLHVPAASYLLCQASQEDGVNAEQLMAVVRRVEMCAVLRAAAVSVPPAYVVENADALLASLAPASPTVLKDVATGTVRAAHALAGIAAQLARAPPPQKASRRLLNAAFRLLEGAPPADFCAAAPALLEFAFAALPDRDVCAVLGQLRTTLCPEKGTPHGAEALKQTVAIVVGRAREIDAILRADALLPILDAVPLAQRTEACCALLSSLVRYPPTVADAVYVSTVLELGRALHDSITSTSTEDERRIYSALLSSAIPRVDFGPISSGADAQLRFLADCRAGLCPRLPAVQEAVVAVSIGMAYRFAAAAGAGGLRASAKQSSLCKACLAFAHISIPTIVDPYRRSILFCDAGCAALTAGFLPHADVLLRFSVNTLKEIERDDLCEAACLRLLSTAVATPGHPQLGPLYILDTVYDAVVLTRAWGAAAAGSKVKLLCAAVAAACAMGQERLPYRAAAVRSNDELYAFSPEYRALAGTLASRAFSDALDALAELHPDMGTAAAGGAATAPEAVSRRFATAALDVVNTAVACGRLEDAQLAGVANKIMALAAKHAATANNATLTRHAQTTAEALKRRIGAAAARASAA